MKLMSIWSFQKMPFRKVFFAVNIKLIQNQCIAIFIACYHLSSMLKHNKATSKISLELNPVLFLILLFLSSIVLNPKCIHHLRLSIYCIIKTSLTSFYFPFNRQHHNIAAFVSAYACSLCKMFEMNIMFNTLKISY